MIVASSLGDRCGDARGVRHVHGHHMHARVRRGHRVEHWGASPGDHNGIASFVQRHGEAAADAGTAAGDQDRVAGESHLVPPGGNAEYWRRTNSSKLVGGRPSSQVSTFGLPMKSWLL